VQVQSFQLLAVYCRTHKPLLLFDPTLAGGKLSDQPSGGEGPAEGRHPLVRAGGYSLVSVVHVWLCLPVPCSWWSDACVMQPALQG
jgi:hypothetical protein